MRPAFSTIEIDTEKNFLRWDFLQKNLLIMCCVILMPYMLAIQIIVISLPVWSTTQKRVIIKLKFEEIGEYYRVSSAGPVRPEYYRKETPLWERAQSNHSVTGTPDAISGQSGIADRNIPPNTSEHNTLFHPQETGIALRVYAAASGSITPLDGNYYIQFFRGGATCPRWLMRSCMPFTWKWRGWKVKAWYAGTETRSAELTLLDFPHG